MKTAKNSIIIVNFNYRVGPYGFLASKEIADDKDLSLNNGLKDQRLLLKWVQKHISKVSRYFQFVICPAILTLPVWW